MWKKLMQTITSSDKNKGLQLSNMLVLVIIPTIQLSCNVWIKMNSYDFFLSRLNFFRLKTVTFFKEMDRC